MSCRLGGIIRKALLEEGKMTEPTPALVVRTSFV